MIHLLESVALDGAPADRQFTIRFDVDPGVDSNGFRQFVVSTARGNVTLDPLDLSYSATFGMCSVFASDLGTPSPPRID